MDWYHAAAEATALAAEATILAAEATVLAAEATALAVFDPSLSLTKFHPFPRCLPEIKVMIYARIPLVGRIIEFVPNHDYSQRPMPFTKTPYPSLLLVNKEFRAEFLKVYKSSFGNNLVRAIPFLPNLDTLAMREQDINYSCEMFGHSGRPSIQDYQNCSGPTIADINLITRLILKTTTGNWTVLQIVRTFWAISRKFPRLQLLTIHQTETYFHETNVERRLGSWVISYRERVAECLVSGFRMPDVELIYRDGSVYKFPRTR